MKNIRKDEIDFENTEIWKSISDLAKDLVDWLLSKDPLKRPTAEQILQHPWFELIASEHLSDDALGDDVSLKDQQNSHLNPQSKEIIDFPKRSQSTLSFSSQIKSE